MALAQTQRALAKLYTSETARARLRADADSFAREFQLTARELTDLRTLSGTRLHAYVDSLDRKRAAEAARLLPLSAHALGSAFARAFRAHARRVPLAGGAGRYARDAMTFAANAGRDPRMAPALRELLDYESNWLRAGGAAFRLRARRYAYPIPALARRLAAGEAWREPAPHATLAVWVAAAGRCRLLAFSWGRVGRAGPVV